MAKRRSSIKAIAALPDGRVAVVLSLIHKSTFSDDQPEDVIVHYTPDGELAECVLVEELIALFCDQPEEYWT